MCLKMSRTPQEHAQHHQRLTIAAPAGMLATLTMLHDTARSPCNRNTNRTGQYKQHLGEGKAPADVLRILWPHEPCACDIMPSL